MYLYCTVVLIRSVCSAVVYGTCAGSVVGGTVVPAGLCTLRPVRRNSGAVAVVVVVVV
jgi:hypothetical protein